MRSKLLFIVLTALFSQYAVAGAHNAKSPEGEARAKSESCIKCHAADEVLLKNTGVDSITGKIKSIQAGDTPHPPGLENLSDDEVTEIAQWLDRGPL
jgi:cytochrome c553